MTEQIEVKPKNKGGRPLGTKKEKGGKNFWVPVDLVETVALLIQANRQKREKTS